MDLIFDYMNKTSFLVDRGVITIFFFTFVRDQFHIFSAIKISFSPILDQKRLNDRDLIDGNIHYICKRKFEFDF